MNRIKDLRKERKLTQEKLAKDVGISRSAIAMYETNECDPSSEMLITLAAYFDVSTDYVLCLTDIKKTPTSEDVSGLTPKQLKILEMMDQMTPDQQDEMVRQADYLLWQRRQQKDDP